MDYAQITIYSIHKHFLYISICKKKKLICAPVLKIQQSMQMSLFWSILTYGSNQILIYSY